MSLATTSGRRWSLQVHRARMWMVTAVMGLQWGLTTQAMEVIWRVAIDERPVWELAGLDGVPPPSGTFLRCGQGRRCQAATTQMTMTKKKVMTTRMTESKR